MGKVYFNDYEFRNNVEVYFYLVSIVKLFIVILVVEYVDSILNLEIIIFYKLKGDSVFYMVEDDIW